MLDRWFVEDIQGRLNSTKRFVIIDPDNKSQFLKELVEEKHIAETFDISSALDELKVKYEIEKNYQEENTVIFSGIPLKELSFIREYCETGGNLDLTLLHRYIKQKVNDHLGFDLINTAEEITAIGKLSLGKQKDYWERIKANGKDGIFGSEDILEISFYGNTELNKTVRVNQNGTIDIFWDDIAAYYLGSSFFDNSLFKLYFFIFYLIKKLFLLLF